MKEKRILASTLRLHCHKIFLVYFYFSLQNDLSIHRDDVIVYAK